MKGDRAALRLVQQAVAADPGYGRAHAARSRSLAAIAINSARAARRRSMMTRLKAARRAVHRPAARLRPFCARFDICSSPVDVKAARALLAIFCARPRRRRRAQPYRRFIPPALDFRGGSRGDRPGRFARSAHSAPSARLALSNMPAGAIIRTSIPPAARAFANRTWAAHGGDRAASRLMMGDVDAAGRLRPEKKTFSAAGVVDHGQASWRRTAARDASSGLS